MELSQIRPGLTDRAAFIGTTGSGKTFLAAYMCRFRKYVVCHDPKDMLSGKKEWRGYKRYTQLQDLVYAKEDRLIYAPNLDEVDNDDIKNAFFKWVYLRQNCVLYIDELYQICENGNIPAYFNALLTRGRERNISVYCATQRPSRIPLTTLSECENFYIFRTQMPQDKKRIEEITALPKEKLDKLTIMYFYYCSSEAILGPHILKTR